MNKDIFAPCVLLLSKPSAFGRFRPRRMFVVGNLSEMPMGQQIHRRKRRPWDPTYNFVTTHANSLVPCKGSFISTINNLSPIQTTPNSRFCKNPFGSWLEMGVDDGLLQSSATKPPMNEIFFFTLCSLSLQNIL